MDSKIAASHPINKYFQTFQIYDHTTVKAIPRGGFLGYEEFPQTEKCPPKGLLECTKRSTRMHKKVHWNVRKGPICLIKDDADINLDFMMVS